MKQLERLRRYASPDARDITGLESALEMHFWSEPPKCSKAEAKERWLTVCGGEHSAAKVQPLKSKEAITAAQGSLLQAKATTLHRVRWLLLRVSTSRFELHLPYAGNAVRQREEEERKGEEGEEGACVFACVSKRRRHLAL